MSKPQEIAQTIALQAVGFIVSQERILLPFLSSSGLALADLQAGLESPDVLAAVLDWLLQHEQNLLMFCADFDVTPDLVWRARNQLPGAPAQQHQSI
ncbi:MAG: DUF3572 domain-containing protein [Pseudomonadota bacterium]